MIILGCHRRRRPRGRAGRRATCRSSRSAFRRSTMACTGLEFCKLAIVETKARASDLIDELERRMPDFDEPIGINVNGCPNACARFQVADIGLKGCSSAARRASRSTSAARWGRGRARPQGARAQGHRGRAARLRRADAAAASRTDARTARRFAVLGAPRRRSAAEIGRVSLRRRSRLAVLRATARGLLASRRRRTSRPPTRLGASASWPGSVPAR